MPVSVYFRFEERNLRITAAGLGSVLVSSILFDEEFAGGQVS